MISFDMASIRPIYISSKCHKLFQCPSQRLPSVWDIRYLSINPGGLWAFIMLVRWPSLLEWRSIGLRRPLDTFTYFSPLILSFRRLWGNRKNRRKKGDFKPLLQHCSSLIPYVTSVHIVRELPLSKSFRRLNRCIYSIRQWVLSLDLYFSLQKVNFHTSVALQNRLNFRFYILYKKRKFTISYKCCNSDRVLR